MNVTGVDWNGHEWTGEDIFSGKKCLTDFGKSQAPSSKVGVESRNGTEWPRKNAGNESPKGSIRKAGKRKPRNGEYVLLVTRHFIATSAT